MSTRLNVNINSECADALRSLATEHDVTITEEVRRAVSAYVFFREAQRAGKQIVLRNPANGAQEIVETIR